MIITCIVVILCGLVLSRLIARNKSNKTFNRSQEIVRVRSAEFEETAGDRRSFEYQVNAAKKISFYLDNNLTSENDIKKSEIDNKENNNQFINNVTKGNK